MNLGRELVRHFLAALAYRLQKSIRGAPESYWGFEAGEGVRSPRWIVRHMNGVLGYALLVLQNQNLDQWCHLDDLDPQGEVARFHQTLQALDHQLQTQADIPDELLKRILQGPLCDAMTHIGQLATLRRLAGSPVWAENFLKADVQTGKVSADQGDPVSPDPE